MNNEINSKLIMTVNKMQVKPENRKNEFYIFLKNKHKEKEK